MFQGAPGPRNGGGQMGRIELAGVCHPRQRLDLIRAAGFGWVRTDVPFPWRGRIGELGAQYLTFRARAHELGRAGLQIEAISPYPRGWDIPEAADPGSPTFLATYREACRFLAQDLGSLVPVWQVANEMNLEMFRRPLDEVGALAYLRAGAAGLAEGNPSARVGVNMAGFDAAAMRMYRELYGGGKGTLDWVGTDGYFGSWEAGGPDSWIEKLDHLTRVAGRPVIIQEFGYASAGRVLSADERTAGDWHRQKGWGHGWAPAGYTPEHTAALQAVYAARCLDLFSAHPAVQGLFWYCWSDHERCWQCHQPDCPLETAWGLVTVDEQPKPAYAVFASWRP